MASLPLVGRVGLRDGGATDEEPHMFTLQHLPTTESTEPSVSAEPTPARPSTSPRPIITRPHHPLQTLAALVDAAAVRPLEDLAGWAQLTAAARRVIDESIARGHVPAALAVVEGEPPVVVRRTIAAAWRHAARTVGTRTVGRETDGRETDGRETDDSGSAAAHGA